MSDQPNTEHSADSEANENPLDISNYLTLFTSTFCSPVEGLPMDQGEYIRIVTEWTTEDALDHLFPSIAPTTFAELAEHLNSESSFWIKREDEDE